MTTGSQMMSSLDLIFVQTTDQTLQWPDIADCVIYLMDEDPSVVDWWENQEAFTVVMLLPHVSEMVEKFRMKVVSLDGLFKSNKLRFLLYTLGVTDERGHTWPIMHTQVDFSFAAVGTSAGKIVPNTSPLFCRQMTSHDVVVDLLIPLLVNPSLSKITSFVTLLGHIFTIRA